MNTPKKENSIEKNTSPEISNAIEKTNDNIRILYQARPKKNRKKRGTDIITPKGNYHKQGESQTQF